MDKFDFIVNLILNNSQLNYCNDNKLTIRDEAVILEAIKVLEQDKYESRVKELQKEKQEQTEK